ncbi:cytochrome P450 4C1 isoform X3 [Aethina tumida]|nr:cytochrome P450 4C1 isoform X3 [Aethina tumida]
MKHITKNELYDFLHSWLGTGLLTSSGTKWQNRRKILTPAFHFHILKDFLKVFNEETTHLVDVLLKNCDKSFIDVKQPITDFTLTSIADTAMGINLGDTSENEEQMQYKQAVYKFADITIYRITRPWLFEHFIYSLTQTKRDEMKTVDTLHSFTNNVLQNRKKGFKKVVKDDEDYSYSVRKKLAMLDLLLTYQSEGADITDEGIREEIDTFMFEGHDTTSVALCYLLMILANEQKHQEEIYQEIMDVIGDRTPEFEDLSQLKHMELCIKECLRLYPSVPSIGRKIGEEVKTHSGYILPKDTNVSLRIYDMHHNPNVYENPENFDPYRFLPENSAKRHPFAYLPFSAGPRNCIGQKYAILELKTALCGILKTFKLEAVDTPQDIVFITELVLRTTNPIRVKFIKRS